jgi:hypothetical protein
VVFTEDLNSDPTSVVGDLCRWLSIDDRVAESIDYRVHNATAHARNPKVGRAAFVAKERARGVLARAPGLRARLRRTYVRLGTGELAETMQPQTRARVETLYRDSNAATASALRANGYRRLPPWLEDAV